MKGLHIIISIVALTLFVNCGGGTSLETNSPLSTSGSPSNPNPPITLQTGLWTTSGTGAGGSPMMNVSSSGVSFNLDCWTTGSISGVVQVAADGTFSVSGVITTGNGEISPSNFTQTPATFSGQISSSNGTYTVTLQILLSGSTTPEQYTFVLGGEVSPFICPV